MYLLFITHIMNTDEVLSKLKDMDLSKYPYFEIKELIRQIGEIGFVIVTYHPGKPIFRVRPGGGYMKRDCVSYKPQEYNTTCQRASTPNRTMFYGTVVSDGECMELARITGAAEACSLLRAGEESIGQQQITFSRWVVSKDINLVAIVSSEDFVTKNTLFEDLNSAYANYLNSFPDKKDRLNKISNFFAQEFSRKIIGPDYNYLLSAIFTEIIVEQGYDGVVYPSVQASGLALNVAIKPETVDSSLRLEVVGEGRIYKNKKSTYIRSETSCKVENERADFVYETIKNEISMEECLRRVNVNSLNDLPEVK